MELLNIIPYPLQITFIFLCGLMVGSFANVCIYRLPQNQSVVLPRSFCPSCKAPVQALDNIPVLSFLILSGKCRSCGTSISRIYPTIEIITACVLTAGFLRFGLTWEFLIFLVVGPALIVIAAIDIEHQIIPDSITLPGIVFGLAAGTYLVGFRESLFGLLLGGGIFYLIAEVYYRIRGNMGMGGGDIKYIAAVGALLGWKKVLLVIFIGAFLGAIVGLAGMTGKKLNPLSKIPFGPFLAAGTLITFFFGDKIINLYLTAMGLRF